MRDASTTKKLLMVSEVDSYMTFPGIELWAVRIKACPAKESNKSIWRLNKSCVSLTGRNMDEKIALDVAIKVCVTWKICVEDKLLDPVCLPRQQTFEIIMHLWYFVITIQTIIANLKADYLAVHLYKALTLHNTQ